MFPFFGYEISFVMHNRMVFGTAAGATVSYVKGTVSQKNEFQIISDFSQ